MPPTRLTRLRGWRANERLAALFHFMRCCRAGWSQSREASIDIDRVNSYASVHTIAGWFLGLAYYNWLAQHPPHIPLWGHALLIIVGMFVASILIGGGVALLGAVLNRLVYGDTTGSVTPFAWGAFISPVLAFFAAGYALEILLRPRTDAGGNASIAEGLSF